MGEAAHPHVMKVSGDSWDDDYFYIYMPCADGNLNKYLENARQNFSPNIRHQLFQWIYCLAVALDSIHAKDIRHRDIKPDNILIHGSNILLTDFGISYMSRDKTANRSTRTRGTERYEPPEARGGKLTGRAGDVFSLGCVFYEMAEGLSTDLLRVPFPSVIKFSRSVRDRKFVPDLED